VLKKPKVKKEKTEKKKTQFVLQASVISALRRIFRRYPAYQEIKNEKKQEYFVSSKCGKQMRRVGYYCETCKKLTPNKECAVDHILPVVDVISGFIDYNTYIKRLFCDKNNLQLLCKNCHEIKSKYENKVRRSRKASAIIKNKCSRVKKVKK
jgi:hypothetical protein